MARRECISPRCGRPVTWPGVELLPNRTLAFTWKCHNPGNAHGVIYQVYRRTSPTAEFQFVGASGMKKWVDATLPAGSSQVTYQLQATRSTAAGVTAEFNVNFGVGGGGQVVATVAPAAGSDNAPRIAA